MATELTTRLETICEKVTIGFWDLVESPHLIDASDIETRALLVSCAPFLTSENRRAIWQAVTNGRPVSEVFLQERAILESASRNMEGEHGALVERRLTNVSLVAPFLDVAGDDLSLELKKFAHVVVHPDWAQLNLNDIYHRTILAVAGPLEAPQLRRSFELNLHRFMKDNEVSSDAILFVAKSFYKYSPVPRFESFVDSVFSSSAAPSKTWLLPPELDFLEGFGWLLHPDEAIQILDKIEEGTRGRLVNDPQVLRALRAISSLFEIEQYPESQIAGIPLARRHHPELPVENLPTDGPPRANGLQAR